MGKRHRPGAVLQSAIKACLPDAQQPLWRRTAHIVFATLLLFVILPSPVVVSDVSHTLIGFEVFPRRRPPLQAVERTPGVWVVDEGASHELYSNGLRIETSLAIRNTQRFYQVLDRSDGMRASQEWHSTPAGIVFHTSESPQAPFEVDQNGALQRLGRALLNHVATNRSYNYLIDRFGRVHRIVEELDAAHHAGNSVWAHGRSVYLNLNNSFLAVSFESAGHAPLTSAQVHSGSLLTQLLRSRYAIPIENCVTHAQVSVNPSNMRVGYHTDGAKAFPFAEIGLPENYDLPVAAVSEFGFFYDETFERAVGPRMWRGMSLALAKLERDAAAKGGPVEEHRRELQQRYRRLHAALTESGTLEQNEERSKPAP